MIVAVVAMRMMQVAVHQIIDVIAVRHRFVSTVRAVDVIFRMARANVLRRAAGQIGCGYIERVFFDLAAGRVVQVAVVQVIDVVAVLDRGVAAVLAVLMIVVVMVMRTHFRAPWLGSARVGRFGNESGFRRVSQSVFNQVNDMLISERVIQVRAVPASRDQALGAKET